jgi:hypothetical protein
MAILAWTVSSCMMAGLSFGHFSIDALLCNASASSLYDNKYTYTLYTVILPWLASIREWWGCWALEI